MMQVLLVPLICIGFKINNFERTVIFLIYSPLEDIGKKYNIKIKYNEPMSKYTSMKIGGPCDIMLFANSRDCLVEIIKSCYINNIPHCIIGKGSNLLISDNGLKKAVIIISSDFSEIHVSDDIITADAGASLNSVCSTALENDLTGFEFAYGIPGTVGGAVFMNAGAYDGEMKDVVVSCEYCDNLGNIYNTLGKNLNFSYRQSMFSSNNFCILSVTLRLKKGNKSEIRTKMNDFMSRRRLKQPLEYPSAGSTFKRPVGDYASRLIDICGLKGYSVGGAQVSDKHSGFLINKEDASFTDMINLIDYVKKVVLDKTNYKLECEVIIME